MFNFPNNKLSYVSVMLNVNDVKRNLFLINGRSKTLTSKGLQTGKGEV